jgi:hypothetical protein
MLRVMDTIVTDGYCLLFKVDASTSGPCNYEEKTPDTTTRSEVQEAATAPCVCRGL